MNPLFDTSSLRILESLSFTKTIYAFDFDGTLSKIVPVPSDASLSVTTTKLLKELSKLAPVAIISGRSIDDLKQRLSFKPHYLIGNHGLEGLGNNRTSLNRAKLECQTWKNELAKKDFRPGVEIEDKTYSLAVHYRRSRNKKITKNEIRNAIAELLPQPHIITGKSVINLLPQGAPHKGAALLELMKKAGVRNAFYIGDDDTDEDVFSLPNGHITVTVRVGKKNTSHARYFIDNQSYINRVLKCLIRFHQPKGAAR